MGIGFDVDGYHKRAYSERNRNPFWKNVRAKTKITVEIIADNISDEEAKRLEIYYIALHKRREDGGPLTNITKGGDGVIGLKKPKLADYNRTHKQRLGKKHKKKSLRLMSKVQKKVDRGIHNPGYKGIIYAYKDGELIRTYDLAQQIAKELNRSLRMVRHYVQNNQIVNGILYTRE